MVTANESKAALRIVTDESVATSVGLLTALPGSPTARRAALLESVPEIIGYFSEGSAALAVDFYEETREVAGVSDRTFVTRFASNDRTVKIRRGVAWASDPLFDGDEALASSRLAEIVQLETSNPYRDTILTNRRADPAAAGWQRITGQCCRFCRMLGDRGAVYREATARFAAHPNCDCTAAPVFDGGEMGPEASAMQYMASRRNRTPATRARIRDYLDANYPE